MRGTETKATGGRGPEWPEDYQAWETSPNDETLDGHTGHRGRTDKRLRPAGQPWAACGPARRGGSGLLSIRACRPIRRQARPRSSPERVRRGPAAAAAAGVRRSGLASSAGQPAQVTRFGWRTQGRSAPSPLPSCCAGGIRRVGVRGLWLGLCRTEGWAAACACATDCRAGSRLPCVTGLAVVVRLCPGPSEGALQAGGTGLTASSARAPAAIAPPPGAWLGVSGRRRRGRQAGVLPTGARVSLFPTRGPGRSLQDRPAPPLRPRPVSARRISRRSLLARSPSLPLVLRSRRPGLSRRYRFCRP